MTHRWNRCGESPGQVLYLGPAPPSPACHPGGWAVGSVVGLVVGWVVGLVPDVSRPSVPVLIIARGEDSVGENRASAP